MIEEFLVVLGANTETEKVQGFSAALAKVATIGAVVVGALKAVTLAAWNFADSYIRRADELAQANSDLYEITKEQVEMSKKYQEGMGKLGDIIESIKIKVAFGFLPTMLNMVDTFNKFLDANKDLIANGITRLLNIVSYASQVINNTVRFIVKAIEATIGWKGALFVLGAAFLFLRRAMLLAFITNPITWVIAAIVGLMLLIDDFMTYLDGGESQFGEFWGSMLEWIDKVKPQLMAAWELFKTGMGYLKDFGIFVATYFGGALVDAVQVIVAALTLLYAIFTGNTDLMAAAWDGLVENLISMFQNFAMLFQPIAELLVSMMKKVWDSIVNYVSLKIESMINAIRDFVRNIGVVLSTVFDVITQPFERAFNWISEKFGALGGLIGNAVSGAGRLFGIGSNSAVSNSSSIMNTTTINAPISVSSSDPNKAAKLTQTGVNNIFNAAQRNTSSRVKI